MAIERLELADGQWADIERRPTHGTIKRIARESRRASNSPDPLEAEDMPVACLVNDWYFTDEGGATLSFQKANFDKVPGDIWNRIVESCTDVLESAVPNSQTRRF